MDKKDIFIGFLIGILTSLLGSFLFIAFYIKSDIFSGIQILRENGYLGKVITIGTILDLIAFGILLKINRELMARGVILAVIVLALSTLFI
ncbi:hypothetical protein SGQ44_04110 [Flavobacterium sp. Fl-77]|uniref:Uncharacterized protein n=1 Tax=Flavobacterium flavipigmentatum TaxID=2893884 RepID=A0AAJ2S7G0_9FLAO|nr:MULTISPECIES: hypothetical protein [unclassified Flavobacterium]MDX6181321.1 hypothetical protein [Flavobacterium sp. Fl-33]MDX6184922.1 hypothetical protein [Flavobacterium sp. Fl-77]UFH40015.1 hypothetical protein LNP22_07005 [Flavobacterium sp. F-70]